MKKKSFKHLQLNKKSISNIQSEVNVGGHKANTWTSYWAYCETNNPVQCRSMEYTGCFCDVDR